MSARSPSRPWRIRAGQRHRQPPTNLKGTDHDDTLAALAALAAEQAALRDRETALLGALAWIPILIWYTL